MTPLYSGLLAPKHFVAIGNDRREVLEGRVAIRRLISAVLLAVYDRFTPKDRVQVTAVLLFTLLS